MKARDIARHLESDKRSINAILYDNEGLFQKDPTYLWALIEVEELEICFPNIRFLDCEELENVLLVAGCPASSSSSSISFIMGEKCFVMLEASARLLALCNQLVAIGKTVSVDFTASQSALTYLDRCGFLDHLDDKVTVLPIRPKWSRSRKYRNQSVNLIEIREIRPDAADADIPRLLTDIFIKHAGESYHTPAFTIFSELFANVCEHSHTPFPGFAGLQKYTGRAPHIQTIVSDSGIGILASLRPVLKRKYPGVAAKFDLRDQKSGLELIKKMVIEGGITSRSKKEADGGSGLAVSQMWARKLDAKMSIRQANSELVLRFEGGKIAATEFKTNLVRIDGTQVCFDFSLTKD